MRKIETKEKPSVMEQSHGGVDQSDIVAVTSCDDVCISVSSSRTGDERHAALRGGGGRRRKSGMKDEAVVCIKLESLELNPLMHSGCDVNLRIK